nr:hypothetical protein [Tanacetum cinerariifolium]
MFNELLNPPPSVVNQAPEAIAPIIEVIPPVNIDATGSPSSTTVEQDAPSTSNSPTPTETQSSVIPQDVRDDNLDMEEAHMGNDPLFGVPIPEVNSAQSTTLASPQAMVQTNPLMPHHNSKWTKDHPLNNIIGQLSRPVSTRLQLHEQAIFCYYDAFLTYVEPKTYKEALTQSCWIEAMQEELNDQPDGFVDPDNLNHVYKLKKALYGLKQAPRAWYDMLSSFLLSQDFSKGSVDPTLFIRKNGNDLLLVQIYVDDIIFAVPTLELCDLFANLMCSKFKMSMMGKISFFLGLQISQSPRGIFINQSKYALESLKKYGFESCDPVDTPMVEKFKLDEDKEGKAVDPSHYRGMICNLHVCPVSGSAYRKACTCGKKDLSIPTWNRSSGSMVSEGFFCCLNIFCRCGSRWLPRYSPNMEAEYIALSGCCAQILWMRSQLLDYGIGFNKIPMYCDNKSAIALCCNNVQHSWSKHIDIRYHFIKEQVENGVIELYFVNTEYQLADLFNKALGRDIIEFLTNKLGMRSFMPETLKQLMNEDNE